MLLKNYILTEGIFTFVNGTKCINDYFNVYVGLVSGKESVFCNPVGNIELICKEGVYKKYIFINEFPCDNKDINKYLLDNKNLLTTRKIIKIKGDNWWKWGAIRNLGVMTQNGKCIYVKNLSRDTNIAFVGDVGYFGGNLLMLKPKCNINLDKVVDYLNSKEYRDNYTYSNRFNIGQKILQWSYFNIE